MVKSRWAVLIVFTVHGMVMAGWISRIPHMKNKLDMSEGTLGLVLLGASAGIVLALPWVGGFINRLSSRRVTVLSAIFYASMLPVLMLMSTPLTLALALLVYGAGAAFMDVSMNAQAVEVERQTQRPLMSSFHGAFSIGNFLGAILSSLLISQDLAAVPHLIIFTLLAWLFLGLVNSALVSDPPSENGDEDSVPIFSLPPRAILPLGLIAFCAAIGEGAMNDWTPVYLEDTIETSESFATLGFAAFALMMTVGRFTGDYLIARFGRVFMIQGGAVVAVAGLLISILFPSPYAVLVGFGLAGAGLSLMIPIVFSAAGRIPGIPAGTGIASAASLGYLGFLAGPPIIGLLAEISSLRLSFIFVAVLLVFLFFIARSAMPEQVN